jgi:hypothetical protein
MMAFLKALVLGIFLAGLVSLFIGSGGSSGGMLNVFQVTVEDWSFFWSWPLLVIGTALAFGLCLIMD